jgi:hypothetical protein
VSAVKDVCMQDIVVGDVVVAYRRPKGVRGTVRSVHAEAPMGVVVMWNGAGREERLDPDALIKMVRR